MDWLPQSGLAISERRTAWPSNFAPVPCGSTATTSSMRRCRSEGTSNRVGVARWATMSSTSIRKPRRFAPGSRNSTANTKDGGHHHCPFFLNDGFWPQRRQVITVKSDIQCSDWDLGVFDSCDDLAQSLSDGYSAPSNSYQP